MALLHIESFDAVLAADLIAKWGSSSGLGATGFSIISGRNGSAARAATSSAAGLLIKPLPSSQQTVICGMAIRATPNATQTLFGFRDSGTNQVEVRLNAAGQLIVSRNNTALATGATALTAGVWYYVEAKFKIDNTTGTTEVRINGVADANLTLTGQDTQNTANATVNQFYILSLNGGYAVDFDDVYCLDSTGSAPNNTFLGDVKVEALLPSGNGNSSQFTGSDGNSTDNYLLVDDATEDGDTTYVEDGTVGHKDTYAFADMATATGTVYGVQLCPFARKTDAGARSIKSVARLSATEVDDSTDKALSTTYAFYPDIRETKPGGGAWTISDVNSAEFGYKVTV